jgi:hypothetical protein
MQFSARSIEGLTMTTKFDRAVYRETQYATIRSVRERLIVCGLERGDIISFRLKGERKKIEITAVAVFRYASKLDAVRIARDKVAARKNKRVKW